MSKATETGSTRTPVVDRRRVLTATAGVAATAAASVPAAAAAEQYPSAALIRWRKARAACLEVEDALALANDACTVEKTGGAFKSLNDLLNGACGQNRTAQRIVQQWISTAPPFDHGMAEISQLERAHKEAEDAWHAASVEIRTREVRSCRDLAELAEVVIECMPAPCDVDEWTEDGLRLLFSAQAKMSGGGYV